MDKLEIPMPIRFFAAHGQGQPQLLASIWYGLFAPAGTPPDIVERIGSDVREILAQPAFAEQHARSKGLDVVGSTSQEVTATIRDETKVVGALIRAAGVQPE